MAEERDARGRFRPGCQPGPGRPPKQPGEEIHLVNADDVAWLAVELERLEVVIAAVEENPRLSAEAKAEIRAVWNVTRKRAIQRLTAAADPNA